MGWIGPIITVLGFLVQIVVLIFTLKLRVAIAELKTEIIKNRWDDAEAMKRHVEERLSALTGNHA